MNKTNHDCPLVNLTLFAYNQEQYIREAFEGTFSRIYELLKVILSNDCSRDRVFEFMQAMSAAYEGLQSGPVVVFARRIV